MARGDSLIRQWDLIKILQNHRYGITSNELAEKLECSGRQLKRDLKVLENSGFPISYEAREYNRKYYKLPPHFIQDGQLLLNITDLISLYLCRQLLIPFAGTLLGEGFESLIERVKKSLPEKALNYFSNLDNSLVVKNIALQDYSKHNKKIRIINEAVTNGKVLELTYKSQSKKKPYVTGYQPYGMVFFSNNLYCIGFMSEYQEIRTLKVNRIIDLKLTDESFVRPDTFSLSAYIQGSFGIFGPGKQQTIEIQLKSWAASVAREQTWHPTQRIIKDADGELIVQFKLSETTEFKQWVLGFGSKAKVLKPKSLSDEILAELKVAQSNYKS